MDVISNRASRVSPDPEVLAKKKELGEKLYDPRDALKLLEELASKNISRHDPLWEAVAETCLLHIVKREQDGEDIRDYKERYLSVVTGKRIEIRKEDFPGEYGPVKVRNHYNYGGGWRK